MFKCSPEVSVDDMEKGGGGGRLTAAGLPYGRGKVVLHVFGTPLLIVV